MRSWPSLVLYVNNRALRRSAARCHPRRVVQRSRAIAALIIFEAASVADLVASAEQRRNAVWALAAFFGRGVVMNTLSRSKKERRMAIVAAPLSVLWVTVALGRQIMEPDH
jgi:hypothetical protein